MDWAPMDMGEAGISDAHLESSIRRICAEADLDNLTKKGVRKQLEQEHGVSLDQRKETINRIIEKVLNGEYRLCARKG
jgi:chitin synthase